MTDHLRDRLTWASVEVPGTVAEQVRTAGGRRRRQLRGALAGFLGLLVAGSALTAVWAPWASTHRASPVAVQPRGSFDPTGLVGWWSVEDTPETTATRLGLGGGGLLRRDCGGLDVSWSSDEEGAFAATVNGWGLRCTAGEEPPWLVTASAVRRAGDGYDLFDADGHRTAHLSPASDPGPAPDVPSFSPALTPAVARTLTGDAPLPAGLTPVDRSSLTGTWHKTTDTNVKARLTFRSDGTYDAVDGCNDTGSRWSVGSVGDVVHTGGSDGDIGCDNSDLPQLWDRTRSAGLDGLGRLVLVDHDGHELARLGHAPPALAIDVTKLVGWWQVRIPGQPTATLGLGAESYVFSHCGWVGIAWQADTQGLFLSARSSFSSGCSAPSDRYGPGWLREVRSVRTDAGGFDLLAADGTVLARMFPTARPAASSDLLPPDETLTTGVASLLAADVVPGAVTPASAPDVIGSWTDAGQTLVVGGDGTWTRGSTSGTWAGPVLGHVLTLPASVSAGMALSGSGSTGDPWLSARFLSVDAQRRLVLVGQDGQELARLEPAG